MPKTECLSKRNSKYYTLLNNFIFLLNKNIKKFYFVESRSIKRVRNISFNRDVALASLALHSVLFSNKYLVVEKNISTINVTSLRDVCIRFEKAEFGHLKQPVAFLSHYATSRHENLIKH